MATAIKIENVSKQYRLGEVGTGTLSHDLHRAWAKLQGKSDPFAKVGEYNNREEHGGDYVWALKDINFSVDEGEILGIIGRNGAGKSTLLKLLSRVTAPTTGSIKVKGRIASLLEVGTGFHPELTGRENVYLNGAIMGMRRHEITRRLEEIVEFSGCAKYIDTPVKRYSSGMTVRLGFAVAAHLDCEILVVDEVLAVGDAEFQKRCMGKLRNVSASGKTVLFVSHNLGAVETLCLKGVVLNEGQVCFQGRAPESLAYYLDINQPNAEIPLRSRTDRKGSGAITFEDIQLRSDTTVIQTGCELEIELRFKVLERKRSPNFFIGIYDAFGTHLLNLHTLEYAEMACDFNAGLTARIRCIIRSLPLPPGLYTINVSVMDAGGMLDWVECASLLNVGAGDFQKQGTVAIERHAKFLVSHHWQC